MRTKNLVLTGAILVAILLIGIVAYYFYYAPGPSQEPEPEKRTAILGFETFLGMLDPMVNTAGTSMIQQVHLYDGLMGYDDSYPPELVGLIADNWSVSEDGLTYTFQLKKGIKFHSGNEVTATAVEYSMDRYMTMNKGWAFLWQGLLESGDTEVVDDYTVKFHLQKPYAPFVSTLFYLFVMDPEVVDAHIQSGVYGEKGDYGEAWLNQGHEAGSGPYVLKEYKEGEVAKYEAFEDYHAGWEDDQVFRWEFWIIREEATLKLLMEQGIVHMSSPSASAEFYLFMNKSSVNTLAQSKVDTAVQDIYINTANPPLDCVHIRRALAYCFDYESYLENVLGGLYNPRWGPLPSNYPQHNDTIVPYTRDLEKAREELSMSQYNVSTMRELTFSYFAGLEERKLCALLLQSNARDIGITINVEELAWSQYVEAVRSPETAPDMTVTKVQANYFDPDSLLYLLFRSTDIASWQRNPMYYSNPKVDELLDAARITSDEDERTRMYMEVQGLINYDSPCIFGGECVENVAVNRLVYPNMNWDNMAYHYNFYRARLDPEFTAAPP